jgi:hypothetical protein
MTRTITNYAGCKALVVGLGDTGASCVRWLIEHDAQVRATDTREEPPHAQRIREAFPEATLRLGGFDQADFEWADLIVASPGVALATPELQWALKAGKDVVGDVELFARALQDSSAYVIAITGSNGKSTVTSLVGHLCAAVGLDTVVAGNIGLPVLDALDNQDTLGRCPDVWVLELSSFQLETTSSLKPDAATVLNISQDHMDRYARAGRLRGGQGANLSGEGGWSKGDGGKPPGPRPGSQPGRPDGDGHGQAGLTQWTFGIAETLSLPPSPFPLPLGTSASPTARTASGCAKATKPCCRWTSCPSPACTMPPMPWRPWPCVAASACPTRAWCQP